MNIMGRPGTPERGMWRPAAIVVAWALLGTGCASAVAVSIPKAGPATTCVTPGPDRDLLVGVALSGGGSRAALFAAAGLEALARVRAPGGASVLEQVAYLSSVSGGSVAAGYYASHKPPQGTPVLGSDGALSDAYHAFFARFKEQVTPDKVVAQRQQEIQDFIAGSAPGAGASRKNRAVGSSVRSSASEGTSQSRINGMVENRGPR